MMSEQELHALEGAVAEGELQEAALKNIRLLLSGTVDPIAAAAVSELTEEKNWEELNNRFYKTLAFGTGGLRGRTIGATVTAAEQGRGGVNGRPEHPCVGTACMNFYNVGRAMRGLITYVRQFVGTRKPLIVVGHDTRPFSREFAELCAKIATALFSTVPALHRKSPLPSAS